MIINNSLQGIASIYSNHRSNNKIAKAGRNEERRDEIHISQEGQNVREALAKMNSMDDVRHDRVAELENMIAAGATNFIECGPGTVLQGLISKISKEVTVQPLA